MSLRCTKALKLLSYILADTLPNIQQAKELCAQSLPLPPNLAYYSYYAPTLKHNWLVAVSYLSAHWIERLPVLCRFSTTHTCTPM